MLSGEDWRISRGQAAGAKRSETSDKSQCLAISWHGASATPTGRQK